MTLYDEAELAEKIRNAFTGFSKPCPEHATEINRAITELSQLSTLLTDVDDLIEEDEGAGLDEIRPQLEHIHTDINYTLRDFWTCIGRMGGGHETLIAEDYQQTWREIQDQCGTIGDGRGVHKVLERQRRFLEVISKTLRKYVCRILLLL